MNRAILIGRLTADPELRYTNSGTTVASFTLAVDRARKNQQGSADGFCKHRGLAETSGDLCAVLTQGTHGRRRWTTPSLFI